MTEQKYFKDLIIKRHFNDSQTVLNKKVEYTDNQGNNGLILTSKFYSPQNKCWYTIDERHLNFIKETNKSFIILSCYSIKRVFKLTSDFFDSLLDKLSRHESKEIDFNILFKNNIPFLYVPNEEDINISKFEVFIDDIAWKTINEPQPNSKNKNYIENIENDIQELEKIIKKLKKSIIEFKNSTPE